MIVINNLKINNSPKVNEYKEELDKIEKELKIFELNFQNKFNCKLDKIIIEPFCQIKDIFVNDEFLKFILFKNDLELEISPLDSLKKENELSFKIIKKDILLISGEYCNGIFLSEEERKKISNKYLKISNEMLDYIYSIKDLIFKKAKLLIQSFLYTKKIYNFKNILINNFKLNDNDLIERFNDLLISLNRNNVSNIKIHYLMYEMNRFDLFFLNVRKLNGNFLYNQNKISKEELFIIFKNIFYINEKLLCELEYTELINIHNYIKSKLFNNQLKLLKELDNF